MAFSDLGAFEPERGGRAVDRIHDADRRGAGWDGRSCQQAGGRRPRSRAALRLPHHDRRSVLSRVRRAARTAAGVVGLPLALGALMVSLAIVYARTDRGRETVRKLAIAEARKTLPGLEIGAVGGDYVHELSIRDVTVRDDRGGPAVHVDRISAHYGLAALLRRHGLRERAADRGRRHHGAPRRTRRAQPLPSHRSRRRRPNPTAAAAEPASRAIGASMSTGLWSPASPAASRCPMAARVAPRPAPRRSPSAGSRPRSGQPRRDHRGRCSSRACFPRAFRLPSMPASRDRAHT